MSQIVCHRIPVGEVTEFLLPNSFGYCGLRIPESMKNLRSIPFVELFIVDNPRRPRVPTKLFAALNSAELPRGLACTPAAFAEGTRNRVVTLFHCDVPPAAKKKRPYNRTKPRPAFMPEKGSKVNTDPGPDPADYPAPVEPEPVIEEGLE